MTTEVFGGDVLNKPKLRPKVNCNKQTVFAVITSLVGLAGPSGRHVMITLQISTPL